MSNDDDHDFGLHGDLELGIGTDDCNDGLRVYMDG